jgi:hypothetical protein
VLPVFAVIAIGVVVRWVHRIAGEAEASLIRPVGLEPIRIPRA